MGDKTESFVIFPNQTLAGNIRYFDFQFVYYVL